MLSHSFRCLTLNLDYVAHLTHLTHQDPPTFHQELMMCMYTAHVYDVYMYSIRRSYN